MFPQQQIRTQQFRTLLEVLFSVRSATILYKENRDIFAAQDKEKADRENVRGLNLAAVKIKSVHVIKLPM
jgi:hypothetical protein